MNSEQLVIIGSGPAGWTCALYAARANLNPLIYEGSLEYQDVLQLPGGQLNFASAVENFPGHGNGMPGPELMLAMREQAMRFNARVVTENIVGVDLSRRPFSLRDSRGDVITSHALIVATGSKRRYLNLESEVKYRHYGISTFPNDDGSLPRFRNKPIVVVGGGDSACEAAGDLTKFASAVHLVHRRDTLNKASAIMVNRVLSNAKIMPHWNSLVDEVLGEMTPTRFNEIVPNMTGVRLKNIKTGKTENLEAAGMFVAIGYSPNTKFLEGQIETDDEGFVKLIDPFRTMTSVEGVFAAGDVADPIYKQAITAAGMGCKAALDAERWLASKGVR